MRSAARADRSPALPACPANPRSASARRLQDRRGPHTLTGMYNAKTAARPRRPGADAAQPQPEFPGCTPVHLPREELEDSDQRLEYWDGATQTAWICEPVSPYHELPGGRLTRLTERIAQVRGAPIESYGSMDLRQSGGPRSIMQADESVYLHPGTARLPGPSAMVIGVDDYPDVVLEVDHTTDVRRGKLGLYESWGFPEVWVEVPDQRAASSPRSRRAGLTIHLLEDGRYRSAPESRAFPGWTAVEIHVALNELMLSKRTVAVLERVGTVLGERGGTGPDDDPLLRAHRRQGFDRGMERGRAEGERALLVRQAARKFGGDTARQLALLLERVTDRDRLEQAGLSIIECESAAELLDRVTCNS